MSEASTNLETAAREELRAIVQELKEVEKKLREAHQSLAAFPSAEAAMEDEKDNDVSTEIRAVIECVLTDSLGPAIRDLHSASLYRIRGRRKGQGRSGS